MKITSILKISLSLIFVLWFASYIFFVYKSQSYSKVVPVSDYIVVLTGDKGRISLALNSIKSSKAKAVFISGVYEKTTINDILVNDQTAGVYIILGKRARNTQENASEICEWAKNSNIHSLVVITSDYHMIRSLFEFSQCDYDLDIKPVIIATKSKFKLFEKCFKEFHKVLFLQLRRLACYC